MLDFLRVILNPMCWMQSDSYSSDWDRALNEAMDAGEFVLVSQYTAKIGPFVVWTSNHPYASFSPYMNGMPKNVRPSRATILKAGRKLTRDSISVCKRKLAEIGKTEG